jgi:hypothetical protein
MSLEIDIQIDRLDDVFNTKNGLILLWILRWQQFSMLNLPQGTVHHRKLTGNVTAGNLTARY